MSGDALDRLIAAVEDHYSDPLRPPLLLSTFGQRNRDLVKDLKDQFGSLLNAVREAGEDRIQFIETANGREAVAPATLAPNLRQQLAEDSASERQAAMSFGTLPTAVQLAFCVRNEANELVALDIIPPFKYSKVSAPELIRATQRILPDKYRRPGLALQSASAIERAGLWKHFLAWCDDTEVDPGTFRRDKGSNALARLIAAQSPEVVAKLVIPGDIAQMLLKHS